MAFAAIAVAGGGAGTFAWVHGRRIGSDSRAHLAMDMITGRRCAVKCIALDADGREEVPTSELKRWEELQHPNVARCFGHALIGGVLNIYLECVASGSLASFLASFGPVEAHMMPRIARGVLEGLQYLHTRAPAVVHGNLKGTNVLVSTNLVVKLTDYGACTPGAPALDAPEASLPWTAPERVQGKMEDGPASDIWGMGCLMIEMATASAPWHEETGMDKIRNVLMVEDSDRVPTIPDSLAGPARSLTEECLRRDPALRPSSSLLLWHACVSEEGPA